MRVVLLLDMSLCHGVPASEFVPVLFVLLRGLLSLTQFMVIDDGHMPTIFIANRVTDSVSQTCSGVVFSSCGG